MNQNLLFIDNKEKLISIKEASKWASGYLNKKVTVSNISYLIQYGIIKKYIHNKNIFISIDELKKYYDDNIKNNKKFNIKTNLNLNWNLSFSEVKESERTKHVHRIHPYKGKFIPQLVEYFLDTHIDDFKKEIFFNKGDIVLDPFCGSGTTLVQANELGIHAIGIDISSFNAMISNVKIDKHNFVKLYQSINELTYSLEIFQSNRKNIDFDEKLKDELIKFNNKYFPSPKFKREIKKGIIDETNYGEIKLKEFLPVFNELVKKYNIKIKQKKNDTFLDKWFLFPVREEIDFINKKIDLVKDEKIKRTLRIILSRTVRSCRATTHADLATLKEPVFYPYYCKKHKKICKPIFTIKKWWKRYSYDTLNRLVDFDKKRTNTFQICLTGDSRKIDIISELSKINEDFTNIIIENKISGIFTSPPYVGLIDYHEQHAYAYELFNLKRNDDKEIGPLFKGQGYEARKSYIIGISNVLKNCKKYLKNNYNVFIVANDKYNLYPEIAKLAGMKIVNKFKRPVLNRVEKNRDLYFETIFHLKEK